MTAFGKWRLLDKEKQRISAALPEGTSAARVLKQVEAAARQYLRDHDRLESKFLDIALTKNKKGKDVLLIERRKFERGGFARPAERLYIETLVKIYTAATGKKLGRVNVIVPDGRPSGTHYEERRHPFLVASLKAVHKRYPPRLVQEVLKSTVR